MPSSSRPIYGLDDRPEFPRNLVLALQHVLTMFGATVSVPLLLGPAMGMSPGELAILVSSVMLCSGVATFLQVTWGSRLPIIQGVSFSFLAAFFAIIATTGGDGPRAMRLIAGAILMGSLVEMGLGLGGFVGRLRRLLSPVVVGPVIMLIGLALFGHGAPKAGTDPRISGLTVLLIIVFTLILSRKSSFFRIFPILSAVVLAYAVALGFSLAGVFAPGHPSHVDLSTIGNAPWFRTTGLVFPWGRPEFDLTFLIAILAAYFASAVESFGDYHAVAAMAGAEAPSGKQLNRGIGFEGVGCAVTGLLGGFSSTSYSENVALVGITKVASRRVVQIAALLLVTLGMFSRFGAAVATIPGPIVGGLYCALFGLISAVGIQQLAKADLTSDRNLFIAGFSLFMGLSVPAWMAGGTGYQPGAEEFLAGLPSWLGEVLRSVGGTGMAVAGVLGLVLDNVIPGTDQERGLAGD
ncbi:MAG: solute carrier family 23 protein [Gemmatimonadota bacterium]|nr:solute carrier family 23 protein [Gemmatimonadota bacterium]